MNKVNRLSGPIHPESSQLTPATETYNFSRILEGEEISNFNLIRFIVHPDRSSVADQHASKEYWYIAKGEGQLTIDDKEWHVRQGGVFFFDSFAKHSIRNLSGDSELEILSIWW